MSPPKVTKKTAVSNLKIRIKVVIFWILILGIGYVIYFCVGMFPVIAGYGAKNLCSCVYLQGRSAQDVMDNELGTVLGKIGSFSININDSSATGKVLFFSKKKAIYRKGLGCTLVNGVKETDLRAQPFIGKSKPFFYQDTIAWPSGNVLPDSFPSNVNEEKLDRVIARDFVEQNTEEPINTRALLVVYNGFLIAEKYADGFTENTPQMGWSMTKSIINGLVGILVKEGKLKLDEPVPIDEWKYDNRKNITLNNLLQASSGLDWTEIYSRPSDATEMIFDSKDAAHYAIAKKQDRKPNEEFKYSGGTSNILSWLIRQQTGDNLYHRFPYLRLFNKIGMNSTILEPDPSGTFMASSFSYATARDWARFGLLYLNDGVWNGERILPEGWVKYTTTPATPAKRGEYGAQWWLNVGSKDDPSKRNFTDLPTDTFYAEGYEGQYVFVVPSKNLVVVRLGLSQAASPDMNKLVADIINALPN